MKTLIFLLLSVALYAAETPLETQVAYWKARALNAEAAYNNCSSQTATQRQQAEQAFQYLRESQSVAASINKACTDRGGKPTTNPETNEPTCEEKKTNGKKGSDGNGAAK